MPPTEVRPQTFALGRRALGEETSPSSDLLQQHDSASPAVRLEKKSIFNQNGLNILPVQALLNRTHYLVFLVLNAGVWFSLPPSDCTTTVIFSL